MNNKIRPFLKLGRAEAVDGRVPVPPIVFVVFRNRQNASSLRAPSTIDFDAVLAGVRSGDSVTIHELGRYPWNAGSLGLVRPRLVE